MKKFFAKYRFNIIVAFTIVLTAINLLNLYFVLEVSPSSNDECIWQPKKVTQDSTIIVFNKVKVNGVTWNAGIRNGDRLLAINDNEVRDVFDAQLVLNRVEKGDSAVYTVARNGEVFETKVEVKKLINFTGLGYVLLSLIWVIVGFIVLMAKSDGRVQRLFFTIGAMFTLASLSTFFFAGISQNPYFYVDWAIIVVDILWMIGITFLPFVIVHFFWVFPREAKIIKKKYTRKVLFYVPLTLLAINLTLRLLFFYYSPDNIFNIPVFYKLIFYGLYSLLAFVAFVIGFISLLRAYMKLESKTERTAVFIILISFAIGLLAIIYTSTLANVLADTIFNSPEYFMPIIAVAIIPIAFGYSIFRYSLMDVTDVIKNSVYYFTATISIAGTYFLVIYFLGQNISHALSDEYQGLIAAVIFIFFAIIFQSTKDRFQNMLTRKFYPEQFAYQNILVKFSGEITVIVGLDNILDKTVSTIVDALKIRHFAILLKDENDGYFKLKRGVGIKSAALVISDNENKIRKFIQNKIDLHLPPVIEREEFGKVLSNDAESLINEEIATIIPLFIQNNIIGFLLFGLKHSGAQFAGKDLELLVATANQIAVALENARLYESEAEKLKIDRDIENAKAIQESLLPRQLPYVKNISMCGKMISAMQIGGDYYDVIKISDNKFFVIIADVSGKGLAASFYMSKIQTMMRLYCKGDKSPKEILQEVNTLIYNSIEKNWFITLSIALFDVEAKKIQFCRAGHTPLLLINGENTALIKPRGLGLGLEKGEIFNSTLEMYEAPLADDMLFTFFSDGITEDMNAKGEMFGIERLASLLLQNRELNDCQQIMTNIFKNLENFHAGREQGDDMTLVLVRYSLAGSKS